MTQFQLFDKAPVTGIRTTADGYLVADVRVARTGIQEYHRSELGLDGDGMVRVYRPEDEVFSVDALQTYAYRPVTMGHPAEMVTSDNWKEHSIGQTGADIARDGDYVRVPMVVMDSVAIQNIQGGTRELSMGYTSNVIMKDGVSPKGEHYDAVQTGLKMNHLAVVATARGGSALKIGDNNQKKGNAMSDGTKLRTVIVDGLSVETTDAGAQAIDKLLKALNDSTTAHATELATVTTDSEKAIAAKDAEIETLKGKVVDADKLDALVDSRVSLIADAAKVAGKEIVVKGKDAAAIRLEAVTARVGDAKVAGKSEAYIEAMFDTLLDSEPAPKKDAFADGVKSGVKSNDGDAVWGDSIFKSAKVKTRKEG